MNIILGCFSNKKESDNRIKFTCSSGITPIKAFNEVLKNNSNTFTWLGLGGFGGFMITQPALRKENRLK